MLANAYEAKLLQGKQLLKARRLIETRRVHGKTLRGRRNLSPDGNNSAQNLLRVYEREATKQQQVVTKARICEAKLLFIINALKSMLRRPEFVSLLRIQKLETMPQHLAEMVYERENS